MAKETANATTPERGTVVQWVSQCVQHHTQHTRAACKERICQALAHRHTAAGNPAESSPHSRAVQQARTRGAALHLAKQQLRVPDGRASAAKAPPVSHRAPREPCQPSSTTAACTASTAQAAPRLHGCMQHMPAASTAAAALAVAATKPAGAPRDAPRLWAHMRAICSHNQAAAPGSCLVQGCFAAATARPPTSSPSLGPSPPQHAQVGQLGQDACAAAGGALTQPLNRPAPSCCQPDAHTLDVLKGAQPSCLLRCMTSTWSQFSMCSVGKRRHHLQTTGKASKPAWQTPFHSPQPEIQ